jgi:rod shape-determining protein MreC
MRGLARKDSRNSPIRAAGLAARVSRYSPLLLTGVAGLLLLTSMVRPNLWNGPRAAATDMFSPLILAVSAPFNWVADGVGEVTGLTQIRAENEHLRGENLRLKEWYQTALLLQAENQSLKDLLNVLPEPNQSYITTRVIGDSGSSFIKTLLIQAGTLDGVAEGQAVMGGQGMIGRVIESGNRAARVLLLSDMNSHIPVVVEGVNMRAILAGTNSDTLTLEHLPPDQLIQKGARVVTSGVGGLFPAGLPIGDVVEVENGLALVRLYSDPENSSYVQVIQKPEDPNVRQSLHELTALPRAEGAE